MNLISPELGAIPNMALLTNIKDQLLSLLQYRIIKGGNKVFHVDLVKNMANQQSKSVTSSIYKQVQQIISALEGSFCPL
ncbi:MAG: hypothetical protein ACQEWV_13615 [Bacillota bacterium]